MSMPPGVKDGLRVYSRMRALEALRKMRDAGDLTGLIRVLEQNSDFGKRAAAAQLLGDLGDSRAIPALIKALSEEQVRTQDKNPILVKNAEYAQFWIAIALGQLGNAEGLPQLQSLLRLEDESQRYIFREARAALIKALHRLRDVELLKQAANDADSHVSATAQKALKSLQLKEL